MSDAVSAARSFLTGIIMVVIGATVAAIGFKQHVDAIIVLGIVFTVFGLLGVIGSFGEKSEP